MKKLLKLHISFVIASSLSASPGITFSNLFLKVDMYTSLMNSICCEAEKKTFLIMFIYQIRFLWKRKILRTEEMSYNFFKILNNGGSILQNET